MEAIWIRKSAVKPEKAKLRHLPIGPSRNLNKKDLGGVIFGCTNESMQECFRKQLFGLRSSSFHFVQNIEQGLPLFLFNFNNRRMHGIFVAASEGRMNIDPYAWTNAGKNRTDFPAQVLISVSKQCLPLEEDQFKKVIADNYYTTQRFFFELDHAQTRDLISLFQPSPALNTIERTLFIPTKSLLPIEACRRMSIGTNKNIDHVVRHEIEYKLSADLSSNKNKNLGTMSKGKIRAQGGNNEEQNKDLGGLYPGKFSVADTTIDFKKAFADYDRILRKLQLLSAERSGKHGVGTDDHGRTDIEDLGTRTEDGYSNSKIA